MFLLSHVIREYAWGSTTAIPELLGIPPTGRPQAELWLGAHPDSPSRTADGRSLVDVIAEDPRAILGAIPAADDRLPFLMKVLAAASPLSLQVHPTKEAAAAGHAAEERDNTPHDSPRRRYKDVNHKPEMVVALTDFDALCGLRRQADVVPLFDSIVVDHPDWGVLRERLDGADGLRRAFSFILQQADPSLGDAVAAACATASDSDPLVDTGIGTVVTLNETYPGDPGVVVSLLLNHLVLTPGEALYLPAGNVHAYLSGLAIEVMASSDNVLRAGLTPKHVDVDEVMRTVDFTPRQVPYVQPICDGPVTSYRPGADEFALVMVDLATGSRVSRLPAAGPRIGVALDGEVLVSCGTGQVRLDRGGSVFLSDADGAMSLRGTGRFALTCMPSALV